MGRIVKESKTGIIQHYFKRVEQKPAVKKHTKKTTKTFLLFFFPSTAATRLPALTSLVSGHLGLQVLGGDVELGLLVHGRPRFTFTAATVTAATQATAEITACGHAAEDEQGLRDEEGREGEDETLNDKQSTS